MLLPLNVEPTKRLLEMIDSQKFVPDEHQLSDDEPGEPYSELADSSEDELQDESGSDSAESSALEKVSCVICRVLILFYNFKS